jgi:DNA replicative helicase MCM subunit Mcm2 (Cdc46/Mcm family)
MSVRVTVGSLAEVGVRLRRLELECKDCGHVWQPTWTDKRFQNGWAKCARCHNTAEQTPEVDRMPSAVTQLWPRQRKDSRTFWTHPVAVASESCERGRVS